MAAGGFRLYLSLSFLVVSVNSLQECKKIDDCSCIKSNGKTMSLKPIDGKPGPKFTGIKQVDKNDFTFSWNPCTKFTKGDGCSNVLLCQVGSDGTNYPVAKSVDSFVENEGSILMVYTQVASGGYERKGIIILTCDEKQNPGRPTPFKEDLVPLDGSQYITTFASKCVCDGGCADVPGGNKSEENEDWIHI